MNQKELNNNYSKYLQGIIVLILFPALLINLGIMTFIDDEGIRSLVALEMKLSGNYITPKLNGMYYYNKPPLFNWILLVFFWLFGSVNEFSARITTVFCLLGYAATIYYFFRKHFSHWTAFLTAFVFITCGRILFWDSMLGLIDICFSWITFTSFMLIYQYGRKGNWWAVFLLSYLLTGLGFLMKGLPSVVFQGITLLTFTIYTKNFRQLFRPAHFSGIAVFLLISGSYYFSYAQYNDLNYLLGRLVSESTMRTAASHSIWETILHLFTFPFEMTYHFIPWSLMVIYLLRKDIGQLLKSNDFIKYCFFIFIANLLVYWSSPQVFPRYLLMLAPLLFGVFIYLHGWHSEKRTWQFRVLDFLFFLICILVSLLAFLPLFLDRTQSVFLLYPKTLSIAFSLLGLCYLYKQWTKERLLILVLFLLICRIGFNWFVLPDRNREDFGNLCRQTSLEAGEVFKDRPLFIYKNTVMQPTNGFYLTQARGAIIHRQYGNFEKDVLYIIDPNKYPLVKYDKVGEFLVRHGKLTYDIGKLK